MYNAFDNYEEVHFPCSPKPFKTKMKSANALEGALPMIIAVTWVVVAVSCVAFLIYVVT